MKMMHSQNSNHYHCVSKTHEKIVSHISGMAPSAFGYSPGNFTVKQAS